MPASVGRAPVRWPGFDGCVVVAEVGLAHDGSLSLAHAHIDAAAGAGAAGVKFQAHLAEAEGTAAEPWRVRFSPGDETRQDYWRRTAFAEAEWAGLRAHADERGLCFLSSPFSLEAVDLLERVGVSAWKVPSGEIGTVPLLERVGRAGLPVLLSTGMASWEEIAAAVAVLEDAGASGALLQCTSAYPCPPERVGLNVMTALGERFGWPVGLSDHSGTPWPSLAAATLGASVLEVHLTLSRAMPGPDVPASLTPPELASLCEGVAAIGRMRASPVDKDREAEALAPMRAIFTKSIVAARDLPAGVALATEHLALKKPGGGLPARRLPDLLGRRLVRALVADEMVCEADLETAP